MYLYRRRRRSRRDYTKDIAARWFGGLLVVLALYLVFQTFANRSTVAEDAKRVVVQRQAVSEGFDPLHPD